MAEAAEKLAVGDFVELLNATDPSKPGIRAALKKLVSNNLWAVQPEGEEKTRVVAAHNMRKLDEQAAAADGPKAPRYCIVGTWDDWETHVMTWNAGAQSLEYTVVTKDSNGEETFLLLLDGEWGRCMHPDRNNATPGDGHRIVGPDSGEDGECWAISSKTGATVRISLEVDGDGIAKRVEWRTVSQPAPAEDSRTQGSNRSKAPQDWGLTAAQPAPAGKSREEKRGSELSEEDVMRRVERAARKRLEESLASAAAIEKLPIEDDQKRASVQQEDMEAGRRKLRLAAAKLRYEEAYTDLPTPDAALAEDEDAKQAEDTKQAEEEDLANTANQQENTPPNKCQDCGVPTAYMRCSKCLLLFLSKGSTQGPQQGQAVVPAKTKLSAREIFDQNWIISKSSG